jgi:hypothetical protein
MDTLCSCSGVTQIDIFWACHPREEHWDDVSSSERSLPMKVEILRSPALLGTQGGASVAQSEIEIVIY